MTESNSFARKCKIKWIQSEFLMFWKIWSMGSEKRISNATEMGWESMNFIIWGKGSLRYCSGIFLNYIHSSSSISKKQLKNRLYPRSMAINWSKSSKWNKSMILIQISNCASKSLQESVTSRTQRKLLSKKTPILMSMKISCLVISWAKKKKEIYYGIHSGIKWVVPN